MLLDERSVAIPLPQAPSMTARVRWRPRADARTLVLASIVLAALTLLAPSAPTYDPWAWIVWGREIAHLDLVTTGGPSWKPLPVLFTTVFSFFGPAAPALWLVVARAGAIAGVVLAFRVARRLGGGVLGGVAAAAALAAAPWWFRNAAMGNSEGLSVAFLLGTIDRELARDHRLGFGLAVCAGLLRPEAWPFLAVYGLWLLARRHLPIRVVAGAGVAVLALWLLPEWWGSGDLLRAAHRAKAVNPGAPTFDDNPAIAELRMAASMLTVPLMAGLGAAVVLLAARRRHAVTLLLAIALAWTGVVAYMTQDGFSGNQRYLMAPVALLVVLAGAGAGRLMALVGERLRRGVTAPRAVPVALLGLACVLAAVGFSAPEYHRLAPAVRSVDYQAKLVNELPKLVRVAGGAAALRRCGAPATGPFMVPAVAWNLRVHTVEVALQPQTPGVTFQVRTTAPSRPVPSLDTLTSATTLAAGIRWRIVADCGSNGS